MATNPFFSNYTYSNEQNLLDDLVIEAIKIHGIDVYYLTRQLPNVDTIWNEEDMSIFNRAYPIEMYVKTVDGFGGEGDFLSKFGMQIRDSATLSVAVRSFERFVINKQPEIKRPREGDLIYMPFSNNIFKITFVEDESVFYQSGALYVYDLECEMFEYSNERMETGISYVDSFYQYENTLPADNIGELGDIDPIARNIFYEEKGDDIIDFSERDPFSEDIEDFNSGNS